jgi:sensor histidine kinase regulating citrate/malate metabolism
VQLALDDASDLPADAVTSEDLVTIVGNLVDNALDALAERHAGRIGVRLATSGDEVTIEVRDDGPGIPDDALGQIFEAGWSTKAAGAATGRRGLGLALVGATAERLGGSVAARNEGGAIFTVRVPVTAKVGSA